MRLMAALGHQRTNHASQFDLRIFTVFGGNRLGAAKRAAA